MNGTLLNLVVFLPALGAVAIALLIGKRREREIKWAANLILAADFLLSLLLLRGFDFASAELQHVTQLQWIPSVGVEYFTGIDGISLLLILLTTSLGSIACLSSWTYISTRIKEYYVFLMLLQTGMLGVFISFDFFLFYIFWEVMLVPMYFLIGIWGGKNRMYAAIKFFLYTLVGSVLMMVSILTIYFYNHSITGEWTFNILRYYELSVPADMQWWVFLGFFFAFAIKVPMWPFHTWLPDAHVQAPTAGSVILAGVLLKMGTYGFIRLSLPILPEASIRFAPMIAVLSIIAIIYGALVALMQKDWKSLVAYSSVSHMGFITLGIFALNPMGLQGGIFQMISHGITTGGLFLVVGLIYERTHTREIAAFSGLAKVMPVFATFFAIMALASMGLPGLNGFIGEFLILIGAFQQNPVWVYWAVWGIVLAAAYLLWLYQRVMLGEVRSDKIAGLSDLNLREVMTLLPLAIAAIWLGLFPSPVLRIIEPPVNAIVERVHPDYFADSDVVAPALPSVGALEAVAAAAPLGESEADLLADRPEPIAASGAVGR
jgi:NADH-quinone oxidoreductase subunit M